MSAYADEAMKNDLLAIRQILTNITTGSGIQVDVTIGDMVGILNTAGVNINPATQETLAEVRLNTARIANTSGQQLSVNSQSVVLSSNHPALPVSVGVSGQQLMANSQSVTLASNQPIIPVSATTSGQQTADNSLSFTLASNERIIPVSATVSGQQLSVNSNSVVLSSNHPVIPVSATTSGQQTQANSLSVTLASNQPIISVSATVSGQQTMANSLSVALASNQVVPVSVASSGLVTVGDLPYTQAMSSGLMNVLFKMAGDSNLRQTAITATAGKRLQVYFVQPANYSATTVHMEAYYGTGPDITTNISGALLNLPLNNTSAYGGTQWDNGSQLSSASDILSVRTSGLWPTPASIGSSGVWTIRYREV